jgi:nucleoside-diphosphate-sugar epimerase
MSPNDPVPPLRPALPVALILGISGGFGQAVAAALAQRGWGIRALSRRPADRRPPLPYPVEWQMGDALDAASVRQAAEGATLIVHGVNPPDYQRWREDGLPMLAHTIAAAKESGATILFPANIYVFSSTSPPRVDESAVREPQSRKGQVRLEMEHMLEQAAREHGIPVIALRAGDFFGPGITNSWFAQAMAKGGFSAKVIRTLTPPGIAHAWAYVPDLAEAFARLVERRQTLPTFTLAHFAGHADMTGRDMAEAVARVISRGNVPIRPFPWFTFWLGALFVPFLREALEMRWLWKTSITLENGQLRHLIGEEPHTPLDNAVRAALAAVP